MKKYNFKMKSESEKKHEKQKLDTDGRADSL